MKHSCTQLREVVSSVHELRVDGFCVTKANIANNTDFVESRCSVEGYDWEIRFHPALYVQGYIYWPGLVLVFHGGGGGGARASTGGVTAVLSAKIIDHSSRLTIVSFNEKMSAPKEFHRPLDQSLPIYIGWGAAAQGFKSSSLTLKCTITVYKGPEAKGEAIPVPSSGLPRHLGELLLSRAGADVTLSVSGESFAAHKSVLATRSPVFMAKFFGEAKEENSQSMEIQDMDAAVFKAMLHFIYTDAVPELDEKLEAAPTTAAFAHQLLVAADRYGLERLKVMCERRLAFGMDVSTVASMLALAEQRNCSRLKEKCIEFITEGSHENLDAVLASEGYNDLVASRPSVLAELLKAAHGKKRSRSPDAN